MASPKPRSYALLTALGLLLAACTSEPNTAPNATSAVEEAPTTSSATIVTTDSPADEPTAVPLGDLRGQLVVHSTDGSLVVIDADGANRREIADGGRGLHTQPTWSPDGTAIAWTSLGADGPEVRIQALEEEDARATPLATPPFYLYWSPTNTSIAMLRPVAGTIENSVLDVGTGEIEVLGAGQPFYFVWEAGGESLLASVNNSSLIRIVLDDEVSYESVRGRFPLGRFQTPAVVDADHMVIPVVRPEGTIIGQGTPGELESLVSVAGPVSMALSPDGLRVAVLPFELGAEPDTQAVAVSFQDGQALLPAGQVSVIDLDSGEVETLPGDDVLTMNWSPDGETIASLRRTSEAEFTWMFDAEESRFSSPAFTPTRVFSQNYLPFADQYNQSSTWWSPDSRAFVWTAATADGDQVWVDVIADDAPPTVVTDGDLAFWSPR